MRKTTILALICVSLYALCGCWDYRGINELDLAVGIAIDKSDGKYELVIEVINIPAQGEKDSARAVFVESEGETVFEAVRNTKKKLEGVLYLGNLQTLIIGRDVAENEDIHTVISGFIRNGEPCETTKVVIAEGSAREIILSKGLDSRSVSAEISRIVENGDAYASPSKHASLYETYNLPDSPRQRLILPVFLSTVNNGETIVELSGSAYFDGGKLAGFLNPEDTRVCLMITDELNGGVLTLDMDARRKITFNINKCVTKRDFSFQDERFTVGVKIGLELDVTDMPTGEFFSSRSELECWAAEEIRRNTRDFLARFRRETGIDIFGFGGMVYRCEPRLWELHDWDEMFRDAEIDVEVTVKIRDLGIINELQE